MTDEKAEELFQKIVKGCKAIPKIGGMLAAGGDRCDRMEYVLQTTFLYAFFSSDRF